MATLTDRTHAQQYADKIAENTNMYLRGSMTRDEWTRRQIDLWDSVPQEYHAEVCAILVPFGGR